MTETIAPEYEINTDGRVRNRRTLRELQVEKGRFFPFVNLISKRPGQTTRMPIMLLMMDTFMNPLGHKGDYLLHADGDPFHNQVKNLAWLSREQARRRLDIPDLPNERWKDLPIYHLQVSSMGRIKQRFHWTLFSGHRVLIPSRLIKQAVSRRYHYIKVGRSKTMLVSHLVAGAFVPNPHHERYIYHKNGNGDDNRASNLAWKDSSYVHREDSHHAKMYRFDRGRHLVLLISMRSGDVYGFWGKADAGAFIRRYDRSHHIDRIGGRTLINGYHYDGFKVVQTKLVDYTVRLTKNGQYHDFNGFYFASRYVSRKCGVRLNNTRYYLKRCVMHPKERYHGYQVELKPWMTTAHEQVEYTLLDDGKTRTPVDMSRNGIVWHCASISSAIQFIYERTGKHIRMDYILAGAESHEPVHGYRVRYADPAGSKKHVKIKL